MVLVLGVSAGAGGARALLAHSDRPHLPPVDHCTVARRAGGSIAEPACVAITRMQAAAQARGEVITGTAVTCRNDVHAEGVRAALGPAAAGVIDEPLAQLRYLRYIGKVPDSGSVLLYDLGASGLTVTQVDCRTEAVLARRRSTVLSGDGYDVLLRWRLARSGVHIGAPVTRAHRERLSTDRVITATDTSTGERAVVTRGELAHLFAASLHHSASYVRLMAAETGVRPDAVLLLGGCARNPRVRDILADALPQPVLSDAEPERVSARGALLLAAGRPVRVQMPELRPPPEPDTIAGVQRRRFLAAVGVTAALSAAVAGLVTMQARSAPPLHPESPPAELLPEGSLMHLK